MALLTRSEVIDVVGRGSGIDLAASVAGGVLEYRLEPDGGVGVVEPIELPGDVADKLELLTDEEVAFLESSDARRFAGPLEDTLEALEERYDAAGEELETLAAIGALGSLGLSRRQALWQAARAVRPNRCSARMRPHALRRWPETSARICCFSAAVVLPRYS